MKRVIKWTGIVAALLVLSAVGGLALYDLRYFQPHMEEMRQLLADADPEDRVPAENVRALIAVEEGSPSSFVARVLLSRFGTPRFAGNLNWHTRSAVWQMLLHVHFSETEIAGFCASMSGITEGDGLNQLAVTLFSKPLSQLTLTEAATVVVVSRSPGRFMRDGKISNEEQLAGLRDYLLERLEKRQ